MNSILKLDNTLPVKLLERVEKVIFVSQRLRDQVLSRHTHMYYVTERKKEREIRNRVFIGSLIFFKKNDLHCYGQKIFRKCILI